MTRIFHLEKMNLLRDAVHMLIDSEQGLVYAGGADCIEALLRNIHTLKMDVLIIDIESCPDCLDLCGYLKAEFADLQIILHCGYKYAGWLQQFAQAGIRGFVSKNSGFNELLLAIRSVSKNNLYICPVLSTEFSNTTAFIKDNGVHLKPVDGGFTYREGEILRLIVKGYSTRLIALKLFLSDKTIETHRRNVIIKSGVKNTAELVALVTSRGILFQ